MEEGTKEGGEGRGRGESKGQGMEKEKEEETANMEEKGKTLTLAKIIRLYADVLKHFLFFFLLEGRRWDVLGTEGGIRSQVTGGRGT